MVYHHAQHSWKSSTNMSHYTKSGLAPCGSTPPFCCDSISPCFDDFTHSDPFNFRLSNIPTMDLFLITILSPNPYRPTLVAHDAPSEAPKPLFTSVLCGCCRLHRCRQNLTSGEESLANPGTPQLRNIATPHLLPTTANATDVMTIGKQDMECAMVCAMRQWIAHGDEGIAFLCFLWAFVMERWQVWWLMPSHRVRAHPQRSLT